MSFLEKIDSEHKEKTLFSGGVVAGANLRTPFGSRRVELVRPGDLIVTRDNGLQPVRLVWSREFDAVRIGKNPRLAPICLTPRALGPMLPQQRISVAPEQRVLVPGYLLEEPAKTVSCLVKASDLAETGEGIFADFPSATTLIFTFVFDKPQIFCCNGLPIASFVPTVRSVLDLGPAQRGELVRKFPALTRKPNSYGSFQYQYVKDAKFSPEQIESAKTGR